MYKGFLIKKFKEFETTNVYLRKEFQLLGGEGKIIFDQELVQQLDQFIKTTITIQNYEKLIQFVKLFEIQLLLPSHIVEELSSNLISNMVNELEQNLDLLKKPINPQLVESPNEEFRLPSQLKSKSEIKNTPHQESGIFIEEIKIPKTVVPIINLKEYPLGKNTITVKARLYQKPIIEDEQLKTSVEYCLQFKDESSSCQLMFARQRLKEKYAKFYHDLLIQCIYEISNFEIHSFRGNLEIKVTSLTEFNFIEQIPIVNQLQFALQSISKNGEEITVPAIVADVGEQRQQNKRILLYVPINSEIQQFKIPLLLWDQHKQISFDIGDIGIFEGVMLKTFGDAIELKTVKTRFKLYDESFEQFKDEIILLKDKKRIWFPNLVQKSSEKNIEEKPPKFQENIHQNTNYLFNTIVKILKDRPTIFSLKKQKFTKEIVVTSDNINIQIIELFGDRLCSKVYLSEDTIIFITHLKYSEKNVISDEDLTLIRVLPDDDADFEKQIMLLKQKFTQPFLLSQQEIDGDEQVMIFEQPSDYKQQQSKKAPIKIKIAQKVKLEEIIDQKQNPMQKQGKQGLTKNEIFPDTLTLLEGKSFKNKFNVIVQIDELFEVRYQKGTMKSQDIRISDETDSGKLTLWNNQIGDYSRGQTIRIDNVYYEEVKQEFKTSFMTKIMTNVPQKHLIFKQRDNKQEPLIIDGITYQDFKFNAELKPIIEIFELCQDLQEEFPYQYCRGIISDIITFRLSQKCPTCNFTKLTQLGDAFECSGQNNIKHIVTNPKLYCYLKCLLVDYTGAIEAIFTDDLCEQYVPQNVMVELYKKQLTILPYFDCILYREFTYKLNLGKPAKDQELRKVKIVKIFQTNYSKMISSNL